MAETNGPGAETEAPSGETKGKRGPRKKPTLVAKKKQDVQDQRKAASAEATGVLFRDYDMVVMNRREIHGAEYNPRVMNDDQRRRLRAGIAKHGNLTAPTVNKRSVEKGWPPGSNPTLVGGHQRMAAFDAMAPSADYQIEVALVDKTQAEEMEANLLLNNPAAQGDWDMQLLENMLHSPGVELAGAGFDLADVYRIFGDVPGSANEADIDELAGKLKSFQENYQGVSNNTGRDDFYVVVVFRDHAARQQFLEGLKLPDNRYHDGRALLEILQGAQKPAGTAREVKAGDAAVG